MAWVCAGGEPNHALAQGRLPQYLPLFQSALKPFLSFLQPLGYGFRESCGLLRPNVMYKVLRGTILFRTHHWLELLQI